MLATTIKGCDSAGTTKENQMATNIHIYVSGETLPKADFLVDRMEPKPDGSLGCKKKSRAELFRRLVDKEFDKETRRKG